MQRLRLLHPSHLDIEAASRMDHTYFWLLAVTLLLIQQHQAHTSSVKGPAVEEGPLAQLAHTAHRREKRCSCENHKDKECVYFCHIGIVWVNTPSHVVPYGFGPIRLRRELGRCLCTNRQDTECMLFCMARQTQTGGGNALVKRKFAKQHKRYKAAFWGKKEPTHTRQTPNPSEREKRRRKPEAMPEVLNRILNATAAITNCCIDGS